MRGDKADGWDDDDGLDLHLRVTFHKLRKSSWAHQEERLAGNGMIWIPPFNPSWPATHKLST